MRRSALIVASLLALSLTACIGNSKYEKDPMYDAGFSDGCATGTARTSGTPSAKAQRDDSAWESSEAYRAGWKAGYSSCAPSRGDNPGDRDPDRKF